MADSGMTNRPPARLVSRFGKTPSRRSSRTPDPVSAACFTLSIDNQPIGSFTEISGLGVTVEVEELVEGGENGFVHRLPRGMKWQNIVLKRGLTDNNALLEWLSQGSGPGLERWPGHQIKRRTATITVFNSAGRPVRAWDLDQPMPVRWTGPRFSATARELALEELEVSHCGLHPAKGTP